MPALKSVSPTSTQLKHVSAWVWRLSGLTRFPSDQARDRAQVLADTAEGLVRTDLPSTAFCTESLFDIADKNEWFPAFKPLKSQVEEWWSVKNHRKLPLEIPEALKSIYASLTPHEKSSVDSFLRNRAVGWKHENEQEITRKEAARRCRFQLRLMDQISFSLAEAIREKLGIDC